VIPFVHLISRRHRNTPVLQQRKSETKKKDLYSQLGDNYIFLPVALETLGTWAPDALSLINQIGHLITIETGEVKATKYLKEKISLNFMRGNAMSILGTLPSSDPYEEIYFFIIILTLYP